MEESRYYILNVDLLEDIDYINITPNEFKTLCEEQGTVYTQEGFVRAFNQEEINTTIHQVLVDTIYVQQPDWATMEEFKGEAMRNIKDCFFALPTDEQWQEAYEIYLAQPEEDPSGCPTLWAEQALFSADVVKMDTVKYLGIKYPLRTLTVEHESSVGNSEITIAPESLITNIQKTGDGYLGVEGEPEDIKGEYIDSKVYHYVDDEVFYNSAEEICEKHLDIPMKFVEENF